MNRFDLEKLEKFYKDKRVFITGHTGFKGAWLLQIFNLIGAEVRGYSLAPAHQDDLYNLINGDNLCNSIIGDLRNRSALNAAITEFKPDYIFHLAAQALVIESYETPVDTFETNAMGTVYLLEAIRNLEKKCHCVFITTDKVYLNREWVYPYRENDRLGGIDPYSASKSCTEIIINSYQKSFFSAEKYNSNHLKSIAVARAGNVIGGGDWNKNRLVPDIVRSLIADTHIPLRNPGSIRPWQHVLDPLKGYLLLGAKLEENPLEYSQAFNFGPASESVLTVESLVQLAIEIWGSGNYNMLQNEFAKYHEAGILKLEISKAMTHLQWVPKWNANQALTATIEWYKTFHRNRPGIAEFTKRQASAFFSAL